MKTHENLHGEKVRLSEDISELKQIDLFLGSVCNGLAMTPGSIFRIAGQYLPNWGIGVNKSKNENWIEERSRNAYYEEWESGTGDANVAIEKAIEKAGLEYGNKDMNDVLADTVVRILHDMSGLIQDRTREFAIIDIGAGTGDTTVAILDAMQSSSVTEALASKCHFYVLEPSFKRLEEVFERLEEHPLKPRKTLISSNLEEYLRTVRRESFNMVVSNAVFHHMGFLTHLRLLRESLANNGIMVIGDWHTTLWQHPAYLAPILRKLGASDIDVRRFENFFNVRRGDVELVESRLTPMQLEANYQMLAYVTALADELKNVGAKSQLRFFEAHESLEDRLGKLKSAGFETNLEELKRNYNGFIHMKSNTRHLYQKSDIACVTAVAKTKK
jgi:hypothetical protein